MDTTKTTPPTGEVHQELRLNAPAPCRACGLPGKVRNIGGYYEPLCEDDYRRRQAMENDFWNN